MTRGIRLSNEETYYVVKYPAEMDEFAADVPIFQPSRQ